MSTAKIETRMKLYCLELLYINDLLELDLFATIFIIQLLFLNIRLHRPFAFHLQLLFYLRNKVFKVLWELGNACVDAFHFFPF